MKKIITILALGLVVGCLQTGTVKVKTPTGNYEFSATTNGVATVVISNGTVVVEFEGE